MTAAFHARNKARPGIGFAKTAAYLGNVIGTGHSEIRIPAGASAPSLFLRLKEQEGRKKIGIYNRFGFCSAFPLWNGFSNLKKPWT